MKSTTKLVVNSNSLDADDIVCYNWGNMYIFSGVLSYVAMAQMHVHTLGLLLVTQYREMIFQAQPF